MRKILLGLLFLILFSLAALTATIGFTLRNYSKAFFGAAQVDPKGFIGMVREGWKTPVATRNGAVSFLVLGLDEIAGRNEPVLTDTVMFVRMYPESGEITLVSIPRDLWIDQYKTKINALYYYGIEKYPGNPQRFPKEVVEDITGQPIQYVVVLSLNQVAEFIDVLGGIDIDVQRSFTDPLFPRPGVDVATIHDPKLLYETVTFTEGVEHMSGERALIFMRSRHSTDLVEGTDDARSQRQQQVISSVVARVRQAVERLEFPVLGKAYAFFNKTYSSVIDPRQLIAIGKSLAMRGFAISLKPHDIMPLLMNPPEKKHGQWVYEPKDPTWAALRLDLQASASATIPQ